MGLIGRFAFRAGMVCALVGGYFLHTGETPFAAPSGQYAGLAAADMPVASLTARQEMEYEAYRANLDAFHTSSAVNGPALAPAMPTYAGVPVYTGCAENGSCYGDISTSTGNQKTIHVEGYSRDDGTYVRGYFRGH